MDTSSECTKCRDFSAIAIEIFDAGENIAAMFGPQKCPAPSPESLAIFACDGKSLAIAIILAIFRGIMRPHCGLGGRSPAASKSRLRATFWRGLLSGASVCYVAQLCLGE